MVLVSTEKGLGWARVVSKSDGKRSEEEAGRGVCVCSLFARPPRKPSRGQPTSRSTGPLGPLEASASMWPGSLEHAPCQMRGP